LRLCRTYDFSLSGKDKEGGADGELEGNDEDEGFVSILGDTDGWHVSLPGNTDDENDDVAGDTDGESKDVDKWCIPALCSTGSVEPWIFTRTKSVFATPAVLAIGKDLVCKGTGFEALRYRNTSEVSTHIVNLCLADSQRSHWESLADRET